MILIYDTEVVMGENNISSSKLGGGEKNVIWVNYFV